MSADIGQLLPPVMSQNTRLPLIFLNVFLGWFPASGVGVLVW